MKKLVIDSSVIVKWLNQINESLLEEADAILQDAISGKVMLLTSELAKYEICNALAVRKKVSTSEMKAVLALFYSLPIQFIPDSQKLANRAYQIANTVGITYYDAAFIALADEEKAILVTDNFKHHGKTKEIKVIPLKDYK